MLLIEGIPNNSPNTDFYSKKFGAPYANGSFYVFIEDGNEIGAVDLDVDLDGIYIHYISSLEPGKGNGRKMVEHLFEYLSTLSIDDNILGESNVESVGFWVHMGAEFGSKTSENLLPFIIRRNAR